MKKLLLLLSLLLVGCGPIQVVDVTSDNQPILIRAPQPDQEDLAEFSRRYGIRTILNLRGVDPSEDWYVEELDYATKHGIKLISLPLSGRVGPTSVELSLLFSVLDNPANWPILVHCQGGIHRTGIVVALYRMANQHWSNELAIEELYDNYFRWSLTDRSDAIDYLEYYSGVKH